MRIRGATPAHRMPAPSRPRARRRTSTLLIPIVQETTPRAVLQADFASGASPGDVVWTVGADDSVTASVVPTPVDWGDIGGTLADQTDLQSALDGKQPIDSDLTAIAALSTQALGRSLLTGSTRRALASILGVPYVQEQLGLGSAVGASSVAQQTIGSVTIPGGILGVSGRAYLDFVVKGRVDTGNITLAWKLNGTTVYSKIGNVWTADSKVRYMAGRAWIYGDGDTAAQGGGYCAWLSDEGVSGTGTGGMLFGDARGSGQFAASSEDSNSDMTFSMHVTFASSDADHYMQLQYATLVIEPVVSP